MTAEDALAQRQRPKAMSIYRPEAVDHYLDKGEEGEIIRIAPHWTATMYWALLAMLIVGVIGGAVGTISEYSAGAAVIRQDGRAEAAASAVVALRRQLHAAQATLEQRVVRAPHDGVVTDIKVDPGQQIGIGDALMAVVDDKARGLEIIAFLPGGDRPLIEPGMALRPERAGFDYAYQEVEVDTVTDGVIGPTEARRTLGPQLADTLPMDGGGVIMVRASLPTTTFESDGKIYPYHDGMGGTAEVRTRDETILEMLIPALKELSL